MFPNFFGQLWKQLIYTSFLIIITLYFTCGKTKIFPTIKKSQKIVKNPPPHLPHLPHLLSYSSDKTKFSKQKKFLIVTNAWKVSKYKVISGPYFPVFSSNTGKYGPEITPYWTFHAVYTKASFLILSYFFLYSISHFSYSARFLYIACDYFVIFFIFFFWKTLISLMSFFCIRSLLSS